MAVVTGRVMLTGVKARNKRQLGIFYNHLHTSPRLSPPNRARTYGSFLPTLARDDVVAGLRKTQTQGVFYDLIAGGGGVSSLGRRSRLGRPRVSDGREL